MRYDKQASPGRRAARGLLAIAVALGLGGCDAILDVENPNELVQEDLDSPAAAAALANGALSTVSIAFGWLLLIEGTAADELQFVGSRDAWIQLQVGDLRDPNNEFVDGAWPFINEGRWMADEAIRLLKAFRDDDLLTNPVLLARAQLYSGAIYTMVADLFEDFTISDRMENGPPIGPDNMRQMYDTALQNLTEALTIAQAAGDAELETRILAQRARTHHARALWEKLNPPGSVPSAPLVNDANANADAAAALARASDADWRWRLNYSAGTIANDWGFWVNERLELRVSDAYAQADDEGKRVAAVTLRDPITDAVDPVLSSRIEEVTTNRQYGPITVVSAREMHLILAEAALAAGDEGGFTQHINNLRALNGLTPYSSGQIDAIELLEHSRRVNLFNQGRRLLDHYRFGVDSFLWDDASPAATRPGTKFPITAVERRSNCHILGTC